jgi:hypothetical protein
MTPPGISLRAQAFPESISPIRDVDCVWTVPVAPPHRQPPTAACRTTLFTACKTVAPQESWVVGMCLTISNAARVLEHLNPGPRVRGYTRTLHRAGHVSPGDLWRPVDGENPRTVVLVRHQGDRITLTDQYGANFRYGSGEIIATAVPDAFALGMAPRSRGHPVTSHAGTIQRQH